MTNEHTERIRDHAVAESKDPRTRLIILILGIIIVLSMLTTVVVGYIAWREAKDNALTGAELAEQLTRVCAEQGQLEYDNRNLCEKAERVADDEPEIQDREIDDPDPNDPDPVNDPDPDDAEVQDPEVPDAEHQDSEEQEGEVQEDEVQDTESDDPDPNDPDPTDDPDPNDPDPNDPDPDDPDPASPFIFSFTFVVPGDNPAEPDRTYTVTCNSGTSQCTTEMTQGTQP